MQQPLRTTVVRAHSEGVIVTNSVIRNTYILLSMTLLFSAATAWFAMATHARPAGFESFIISLGLLFLTNALSRSAWGLAAVFAFTGYMGYILGPLLNFYLHAFTNGAELIMGALGLTGLLFLALSAYALTTRKEFSYLGGFLFTGMIVVLVASIAAIFMPIPVFHLAIAGATVLLMCGYILHETSAIIHSGEQNYILATISLYTSLYNLFVSLLRIFAALSGRRD